MTEKTGLSMAIAPGGVLPLLGTTVFKSLSAIFWLAGLISLTFALVLAMRRSRQ
jgi:hypothetical protein